MRWNRVGRGLLWLAVGCCAATAGWAQAGVGTSFDVVSIKPSQLSPLHDGYSWGLVKDKVYEGKTVPLSTLILAAYLPKESNPEKRLKDAPGWVTAEGYDLQATLDDATAQAWKGLGRAERSERLAPLLRKMLEERCKLAAHLAPVEQEALALVVDKDSPKLKPTPADGSYPAEIAARLKDDPHALMWTLGGGKVSTFRPGVQEPKFYRATMQDLAAELSQAGALVVDQTGLSGSYDFFLAQDQRQPGDPPMTASNWLRLQRFDQLGLKLKTVKVTVQQVVVDHVERPTAN